MDKEIIRYTEVNGITVIENPAADFPSHWHNAAEFTLILKDGCRFKIADRIYSPKAGDVLLIWPRELHEVLNIPPQGSMFIQFASSVIESNYDLTTASRFFSDYHLVTAEEAPDLNENLKEMIYKVKELYNNKQRFIETKCKILICESLIMIGERVMNDHRELIGSERFSDRAWEYVRAAGNYIIEHSSEDISQADVASYLGLSTYYFSKIFNEYTGTSFPAYLSRIRVQNAISLLLNEKLSITECAFISGFQSTTRFNKAFREVTGCNPREFRKMHARNV